MSESFTVLDVGCRDQPLPRWFNLPGLKVIGWDMDAVEIRRLREKYPQFIYECFALGEASGAITQFHRTLDSSCDSLLAPMDDAHLKDPVFRATGETISIEMQRLDEFQSLFPEGADLLKIDTQGTELGVLRGSVETLKSVLMVEVETEFNPFYAGQALFGDVDAFLRSQGFEFYDFQEFNRYSPRFGHNIDTLNHGQLNWAESFYIPKPLRDPERTKMLARLGCDFPNFGV